MKISFYYFILFLVIIFSCDNRKLPVPYYNPIIKIDPRSTTAELNKSITLNLHVKQDTSSAFINSIKYSIVVKSLNSYKETILWDSMGGQFFLNNAEKPLYSTERALLQYNKNVIQYIPQQKGNIVLVFSVRAESPYIGFTQDSVFLTVK